MYGGKPSRVLRIKIQNVGAAKLTGLHACMSYFEPHRSIHNIPFVLIDEEQRAFSLGPKDEQFVTIARQLQNGPDTSELLPFGKRITADPAVR